MPGQQVRGGNLAGGVDRRQIPREPAHDRQPLAPTVRVRVDRQPRPRQRQLGGDPLSARRSRNSTNPSSSRPSCGISNPSRRRIAQIVRQRLAQRVMPHRLPATATAARARRSALRSTLAYIAVVFCSRWRSTWPISASDAPCLSISVAAVCRRRCAPTAREPRPDARLADDPPDRAAVQPLERRGHPQEQRPALAPRTAAQIGHQRLADIDRQRQHVLPAALAANEQLARAPVDVIELRARRPRRRAAPAAPATTGSRSRAGRPVRRRRSWPAACCTAAGSSPRGSVRSRRSATDGTAHTNGASISPARCR